MMPTDKQVDESMAEILIAHEIRIITSIIEMRLI
jgi:hypothetical protein